MKAEQSRAPYYFQFHIGDYLRDAQELSLMQHGAYQQLMLWYYSTAKPIPNDLDRIFRRVGAMSLEERKAVEYVLSEFFILDQNVWRHNRIDKELGIYASKSKKATESALKKWELEKANKIKETTDANAVPSQCERNANQEPRTINQEPNKNTLSANADGAREVLEFLNRKRPELLGQQVRGFRITKTNLNPIQARLKDGFTVADCKRVIANRMLAWEEKPEMHQYLTPQTIFRPGNFEKYYAALPVVS